MAQKELPQEVEILAREISERVWRRVRAYIRRQQRELHDLDDQEEDD
jgi:hypothetical protein